MRYWTRLSHCEEAIIIFHRNRKKQKAVPKYRIVFCDKPDMSTKFGQYHIVYDSYDQAEWTIRSKAAGWGRSIATQEGPFFMLESGEWLTVEEFKEEN